jgi:uncharacterized protein
MKALVLADTHLGAGQSERLIALLGPRLRVAGAIFHAGDVTDDSVLAAMARFAPVHAVLGNNDRGLTLPRQRLVELAGCRVGMVHDSGDATGRTDRLRRWFPEADVVVFGHSHLPWNQSDVRAADGHVQHHLNPGSPTQRRRAPRCTVAWLELHAGRVISIEHEAVS